MPPGPLDPASAGRLRAAVERAVSARAAAIFAHASDPLARRLASDQGAADDLYHALLAPTFRRLLALTAEGTTLGGSRPRIDALGAAYEALLALRPRPGPGPFSLAQTTLHGRKRSGSYYTPPALVDFLLDTALDPLLDRACLAPDPAAALLDLRVCDPSCGAGHFLVAAARRIALRLASLLPGPEALPRALARVIPRCINGVDIDPIAVELCLAALAAEMPPGTQARPRIFQGDGLFFPWHARFPEILARGGFDCVLGNPPFLNSIEGRVTPRIKAIARDIYPDFGGTADLAYLFLGASLEVVHPEGRVGMIQPRGLLNARSAERFRQKPPRGFRPACVWLPERPDLFPGASVFVTLLVFAASEGPCAVCASDPTSPASWRHGAFQSPNWWSEIQRLLGPAPDPPDAPGATPETLGDRFSIEASMTAGDAYDVVPFLVDDPDGDASRLVTTGLIDPGLCLWGSTPCRYLKRDYRHPRVEPRPGLSKSLSRRLALARRPKILVAGLSRVIECFLDHRGEYVGAVSTYSIFHPHDDLVALEALAGYLLSPRVTALFRATLGANALGGGNTTMKKEFLKKIPLSPVEE